MALLCQVLRLSYLLPNSLPQLASPLGYACPTTLQPVFIPHQEFHKEELALCRTQTTRHSGNGTKRETEVTEGDRL